LPKDIKSSLVGKKNISYHSLYLPQYTAIFFNQKQNEILKDINIRKALALSIDKSKILTDALQLEGEIINGPILPTEVTIDPEKKLEFNPNLANEILEENGWKKITSQEYQQIIDEQKKRLEEEKNEEENSAGQETDENEDSLNQENPATTTEEKAENIDLENVKDPTQEFYRKKGENILEVTLTTVNQPENSKAAEIIKKFWENVGFKVNLEIIEPGKISREVIKPRNYQMLLFGIIVGSNPDPYPFWHSSQIQDPGLNLAMIANREVDKILEDSKSTDDIEIQKQNYQRFQDILISEIPIIPLYHPTYTYVSSKKIKGFNIANIIIPADRFNNLSEWYVKTKRIWRGSVGKLLQP
jgi:ABC-type transport system substrate-binding protein